MELGASVLCSIGFQTLNSKGRSYAAVAQDVTPEHRRTGCLWATARCITLPRQNICSVVVLTQRSTLIRARQPWKSPTRTGLKLDTVPFHWLKFQGFDFCFRLIMQEVFSYLHGRIPEQPPITRCQPCSRSWPWKIHGLNDDIENQSNRHCILQHCVT